MAISFISGFTSCNLSFQNSYKSQAIELFGEDLAHSLYTKEHNWKTLIKSWKAFFKACIVIENSKQYFCTVPTKIYGNLQSNDGLIFQTNRYTRHDSFDGEGILITPFGYFDINFKSTHGMYEFIGKLEEEFYTKLLEDSYRNKKYSFTLASNQEASLKPLYNLCRFKRTDEIRDHTFTESHISEISNIIKYHLNIVIEEPPILPRQTVELIQYLSRGTQTDNTTHTL